MNSFLYNLLWLSVLFTVASGIVFFARARLSRQLGGSVAVLWAAAFICAVLPLPLPMSEPVAAVKDAVQPSAVVDFARGEGAFDPAKYDRDIIRADVPPSPPKAVGTRMSDITVAIIFSVWLSGAVYYLLTAAADHVRLSGALRRYSRPCADAEIQRILASCGNYTPRVRLAVTDVCFPCPPCVCGLIRPVIYIDRATAASDAVTLAMIFTHELSHIRRRDALLKAFAVAVASVYWFNPVGRAALRAYSDDLELASDGDVMRRFDSRAGDYMNAVLEVAARYPAPALTSELAAPFAATRGTSGERCAYKILKRRYDIMKAPANPKRTGYLAAALALLLLLNAAISTACVVSPVYSMTGEAEGVSQLHPAAADALRSYFGLGAEDDITEEMLSRVTSLTFTRSVFNDAFADENGGATLTDVFVNGDYDYGGTFERIMYRERFEYVRDLLKAYGETSGNTWATSKYESYFTLKDPADGTLDERGLIDLYIRFPALTDMRARYFVDPDLKYRETLQIFENCLASGLFDCKKLPDGVLDCSSLSVFPSLETIYIAGISATGVPDGVKIVETDVPAQVEQTDFDLFRIYGGN